MDTLAGGGIKGRGCFKAYETAARVEGGNGGGAAPGADVRHHLPGPGVGLDEILAQLHGFLRGMDGALYRGKGKQVSGKAQAVLRPAAGTQEFSIVGAVAPFPGDFLIGLALFKLRIVIGEFLIKYAKCSPSALRGPALR